MFTEHLFSLCKALCKCLRGKKGNTKVNEATAVFKQCKTFSGISVGQSKSEAMRQVQNMPREAGSGVINSEGKYQG